VASLHDADCFVCPLCALFFLPEFPFIYSFFHLCVIAPCPFVVAAFCQRYVSWHYNGASEESTALLPVAAAANLPAL